MVKNFKIVTCLLLSVLVLSALAVDIEKRIDELTGDTIYSTPVSSSIMFGTELYVTKNYLSKKTDCRYFYELSVSLKFCINYHAGKGISILFKDGTTLKWENADVKSIKIDNGYYERYASTTLSEDEMNILSTKNIKKLQISTYDSKKTISSKFANNFKDNVSQIMQEGNSLNQNILSLISIGEHLKEHLNFSKNNTVIETDSGTIVKNDSAVNFENNSNSKLIIDNINTIKLNVLNTNKDVYKIKNELMADINKFKKIELDINQLKSFDLRSKKILQGIGTVLFFSGTGAFLCNLGMVSQQSRYIEDMEPMYKAAKIDDDRKAWNVGNTALAIISGGLIISGFITWGF